MFFGLALTFIFCFLPLQVSAQSSVGIGFVDERTHTQNSEPNEVLPTTFDDESPMATDFAKETTARRGFLPRTGEQREGTGIQLLGVLLLICCFWLFLWTRFQEEGQEEGLDAE